MKNILLILSLGLGFTGSLKAEESNWTVELGSAIRRHQYVGMLKYRKYSNIIYTEFGGGYWTGVTRSAIGHLSFGFFYKNFSIGIGPAYITHTSYLLGTHLQFISNATLRFGENNQWFIKISHISNGKAFTKFKGPNKGEDFITLGLVL